MSVKRKFVCIFLSIPSTPPNAEECRQTLLFATSQGKMRILCMMERRATQSFLIALTLAALNTGCTDSKNNAVRAALSGPGLVAMAIGNPSPETPVVSSPSGFKNLTYYRLVMQGINIGSAVVARSSGEKSQDVFFELKISQVFINI